MEEPIKNPVKAIRAFCLDCCGDSTTFVKECVSPHCPLYPFRLGKNPFRTRQLTEEQRDTLAKRMVEARKHKGGIHEKDNP